MSILNGISSFCGEPNLGGYRTLKYLPVDYLAPGDYEEIVSGDGYLKKSIVPTTGAWLTLPYLPTGQEGWKQRHGKGAQGSNYAQLIAGVIPKLRTEVAAEFMNMDARRFLVHLTDKNGKEWLIGRPGEPLEFFASDDTGGNSSPLNNYRFRFEGSTTKRAFGYSFI